MLSLQIAVKIFTGRIMFKKEKKIRKINRKAQK